MTVASLLISCVAAVAAIGAVWYGRGQKRAAETASQEARRAADAAADMATIERDRRAEELAEAERNRVVFRLEYEVGSAYRLRNRGTDTAYGVHVDLGGMGIVGDEPVDLPEFPTDYAYQYLLRADGLGSSGQEFVQVTWHYVQDLSDEAQAVKLYPAA